MTIMMMKVKVHQIKTPSMKNSVQQRLQSPVYICIKSLTSSSLPNYVATRTIALPRGSRSHLAKK